MKKDKLSISMQMRRLLLALVAISVAVVMLVTLTLSSYQIRYNDALHNITEATDFNRDFKDDIDLKMYYYVIESRFSTGLPLNEVRAAKAFAMDLAESTEDKDSSTAINSVINLCENLETQIEIIDQTNSYDERKIQLENNIYVITSLIEEYMDEYLYCEASHLNTIKNEIYIRLIVEMVIILAVFGVLVVYLIRYTAILGRSITDPVEKLNDRMLEIGNGNLTARAPVESNVNEMYNLGVGVEQMVNRMDNLMRESTEKQENLRKAELALLQAQINPHFLYNTLDTIIWLIEAEKAEAAEKMVSDLSDFFRHTLSNGKDIISLEDERKQVTSYLQIQQVRYRDILTYTIDIEEEVLGKMLPKLTLQPLVENALYHGLKEKRGGGTIKIKGARFNDEIIIKIIDDGAGIPHDRLVELRRAIDGGERVGFGLVTVHERLRLFFGDKAGLDVESKEGEGTTITVHIPDEEDAQ
ncbi:MAG: sensor histidine kinase [Saccharofermentans sp.]|nr:sensor histidine kinase [Saccharofermentans sp.]